MVVRAKVVIGVKDPSTKAVSEVIVWVIVPSAVTDSVGSFSTPNNVRVGSELAMATA